MVYRGHIQKGVVVFDGPLNLADGTEVTVEQVKEVSSETASDESSRPKPFVEKIAPENEGLLRFAGAMVDLPEDASVNLDHYLYGHPKRE
jgi:hypothetical protein